MDARELPVLAYDGECGFCKRWIERWRAELDGRVTFRPYQELASEHLELPRQSMARAIHFFERDGRVFVGAEAVLRALAHSPRKRWMLWAYENVPGWSAVAELVYRAVARNRGVASRVSDLAWGRDLTPPPVELTRRLFLALLGVVYLAAFVSLWSQVDALIGSGGVLPVGDLLQRARAALGSQAWRELPSVLWLGSSDGAIHALCASGVLASLALAIGLVPRVAAAWAWIAYLSLVSVGDVFLGFQWDALLLETGLLAIFFAPGCLGPSWRRARPTSRAMLWLLRWLVFRLMLMSGVVKLASNDPTWADLSALEYHYWTQPLPHIGGWFAAQSPRWFQHFSCIVLFAIELGSVWLIFAPRRLRFVAAAAIAALMSLISVTGNYGFFTALTLALCVTLLDDRALRWWLPSRLRARVNDRASAVASPARWRLAVLGAFAVAVVAITGTITLLRMRWIQSAPAPIEAAIGALQPLNSFNGYGLFAVMTTERPEIVIEGSDDGVTWKPYEFRWKPSTLERAPGFAGLHMPRLDWQMWFAALGNWRGNSWYLAFVKRLLEGSPVVLSQLKTNPFTEHPPRQIRSTLYHYHFTTLAERARTHAWWSRESVGAWCPTLELVNGELRAVER